MSATTRYAELMKEGKGVGDAARQMLREGFTMQEATAATWAYDGKPDPNFYDGNGKPAGEYDTSARCTDEHGEG